MSTTPPAGPAANPAPGLSASGAQVSTAPRPLLPPHFAEAWINKEWTVCRRRLPAYSFHAHLLLCAAENPFAFEHLPPAYKITWEDLWEAVTLVCTPYGQPVRYPPGWRCVFTQRLHRLDLAREIAAFRAWQNDYLSAPEVFCTEGDGRELTAPGILARVVFLQRHLHGYSAETLWTMPIGQVLWLHAACLEQLNDKVSLLEDEEAKLFELIKRIQEGSADPSMLPPRPGAEPEGAGLLSRAASALGLDRTPSG
jgi:hypothetical protein